MRIRRVDAIPIKLQLEEPFVIANVTNYDMFYCVVRIETDNGIVGFGEATPAWEVTGETWQSVVACVRLLTDKSLLGYTLIGKEVGTREAAEELVQEINPTEGIQQIHGNPAAKAALEQAILDAYGKYVDKPIYGIYAAKSRPVPVTKTIGIHDVEETLARVSAAISESHDTIRLKLGLRDVYGLEGHGRDVQAVKRSCEVIRQSRKNIRLAADANQGFGDTATAIGFCRQVEGCLDWLEQPIPAGDILGFREIKAKTSVPLMADESVHSYEDARLLLRLGGVDYLNVKLMKTGGMLQAIRLIDLAAEYGVECQIGSMLENSLGASMGCHAFMIRPRIVGTDLNSYRLLKENLGEGLALRGNSIHLATKPGTGLAVDDDLISRYTVRVR